MVTALCLLSVALAPAQAAGGADWLLTPRLSRGQEFLYRGTYTDEALGSGVQFTRNYRIEHRVFVLNVAPLTSDVALFTAVTEQPAAGGRQPKPGELPSSVCLDLATITGQGKTMLGTGRALLAPLTGPPTLECGAILPVPARRMGANQTWDVAEEGRPSMLWILVGNDNIGSNPCVKLTGTQQSEDWEAPRADHAAWRRQERVWLSTRTGVACRVERIIEHRDPAHRAPTQRSTVRYDLETSLSYPGPLFDDRQREINQARQFEQSAAPLLQEPGRAGVDACGIILTKLKFYLDNHPPTPYREAVLQVKRRLEAASTGRTAVMPPPSTAPFTVASVGQAAPDFVVPGVTTTEDVRLRRLLGRPTLLVFYSPASASAEEILRFAQKLQELNSTQLTVLGLTMSEDSEAVMKQHAEWKLGFPIGSGIGLRMSYRVEATPKLVLLDADGIVRANYVGWGTEIPQALGEELRRWLRPPSGRHER